MQMDTLFSSLQLASIKTQPQLKIIRKSEALYYISDFKESSGTFNFHISTLNIKLLPTTIHKEKNLFVHHINIELKPEQTCWPILGREN
jgi:hypothetical protein